MFLMACGDGGGTPIESPVDAAAPVDGSAVTRVCGEGYEWPEWGQSPDEGMAMIVSAAHGVPEDTEFRMDGAQRFAGPFACQLMVPAGTYTVRYVGPAGDYDSIELTVASGETHIVGMMLHPVLGADTLSVEFDFTPPADGQWRVQFANFTPESASVPLDIYAFPPGTPNPVPPDAVPTLLGSVARGDQLTVLVPHDTQILSYLPQGSTYAPHEAFTFLLRWSCAAQLGWVAQVVCDSADPYDDVEGGPCDGLIGAQIWGQSLNGVGCSDGV
jgi:hypothetical protein